MLSRDIIYGNSCRDKHIWKSPYLYLLHLTPKAIKRRSVNDPRSTTSDYSILLQRKKPQPECGDHGPKMYDGLRDDEPSRGPCRVVEFRMKRPTE
jgi:hypothetical protein